MNFELFKPANLFAIAVIAIVANKIVFKLFSKHAVDEREKPRM